MSHEVGVGSTPADPSVGELVTQLSEQTSRLVRDELRLAQIELKNSAKHAGLGAGLFSVAGLLALFGLTTLIATAIIALALVLPLWLSALIVAVVLFIFAGIAVLVGLWISNRARGRRIWPMMAPWMICTRTWTASSGPCSDPDCPTGSSKSPIQLVQDAYARRVTLTRRTARFGELAAAIEARLEQAGIVVDPKGIDEELRARIHTVGQQMGLTDRTALGHAPDDLPDRIAHQIAVSVKALVEKSESPPQQPARKRHLRLVD